MRGFGIFLIIVGAIGLVFALSMDTSVATSGLYGIPSRVENIGLIAQRQSYLFVSGLVILVGTLMAIFGGPRQASEVTIAPAPKAPPTAAPENRDLANDAYRLWLAQTYDISRNDVFDRFVMGEQTFGSLDEALASAHGMEVEKLNAIERERLEAEQARQEILERYRQQQEEEEAKWQERKPKVIVACAIGGVALIAASPFVYQWLQAAAERHRQEEEAKLVALIQEADEAGLSQMDGATNMRLEEVKEDDTNSYSCNSRSGKMLTFNVKDEVPKVVVFYDGLYDGGATPDYHTNDDRSATRTYESEDGKELRLSAYDISGSTVVHICSVDQR